jgi:hypothetical protein
LKAREPHALQLLLGAIEGALRIQRAQIAVNAATETHVCQLVCLRRGVHQRLLRLQLLIQRTASHERISHLAEGGLNRLLVLRNRRIARQPGRLEVGNVGTTGEDRDADLGREGPGPRIALEQAR